MTFWADVFKRLGHSSNISFVSTGDAFLYCGINQAADTWRVINLFTAAYVILTHKHLLNESHPELEIDAHGEQMRGHTSHQSLLLPLDLPVIVCGCFWIDWLTTHPVVRWQFALVTKPLPLQRLSLFFSDSLTKITACSPGFGTRFLAWLHGTRL